jgi:hypothetical protein
MTQEEKRIKLAESGGWKKLKGVSDSGWPLLLTPPKNPNTEGYLETIPNYFTDLNAVHELEKRMPSKHWTRYCQYLADFGRGSVRFVSVHATAAQRCEALGLTLGLWEAAK